MRMYVQNSWLHETSEGVVEFLDGSTWRLFSSKESNGCHPLQCLEGPRRPPGLLWPAGHLPGAPIRLIWPHHMFDVHQVTKLRKVDNTVVMTTHEEVEFEAQDGWLQYSVFDNVRDKLQDELAVCFVEGRFVAVEDLQKLQSLPLLFSAQNYFVRKNDGQIEISQNAFGGWNPADINLVGDRLDKKKDGVVLPVFEYQPRVFFTFPQSASIPFDFDIFRVTELFITGGVEGATLKFFTERETVPYVMRCENDQQLRTLLEAKVFDQVRNDLYQKTYIGVRYFPEGFFISESDAQFHEDAYQKYLDESWGGSLERDAGDGDDNGNKRKAEGQPSGSGLSASAEPVRGGNTAGPNAKRKAPKTHKSGHMAPGRLDKRIHLNDEPGRKFVGKVQVPYLETSYVAFCNHGDRLNDEQYFTDNSSCAMDAFNLCVGKPLLSRELIGVPFSDEGISYDQMRPVIESFGFALVQVYHGKRKQKRWPSMSEVLGYESGVFFVEYYWQLKPGELHDDRDFHVVSVNCDQRAVFCNTLGRIPFSFTKINESAKTHAEVVAHLHFRSMCRVWRVVKRAA